MSSGKLTCPKCKNSFLPMTGGVELCPNCGAEVNADGEAAPREAEGWYYSSNGTQAGPVSSAELKRLAASGELAPTDFVRKANSPKWIEAGKVEGLFPEALPESDHQPQRRSKDRAGSPRSTGQARLPSSRPRTRSYELFLGLGLVAMITGVYLLFSRRGAPGASSIVGYSLGIAGFLLMIATETLYTLRKRMRNFHYGRMSTWLKVHIVTGLVGPCLVLLNSGGHFHGLAGVLAALTVVIVVSGFIGRYIYTAVPRTLDGVEITVLELEEQIEEADRELQAEGIDLEEEELAAAIEVPHDWSLVLGRGLQRWLHHRRLRQALRKLKRARATTRRLERLLMRRYDVQVQIASLVLARRLLALWHVLHIPLGAAVFTLAFIHITAALYYAAFVR
jgi:hypothetical protein